MSDSSQVAIRIALIITCGLLLPQLLSCIGYWRSRDKSRGLAVLSLLAAPGSYFIIANLFWQHEAAVVRSQGHRVCGAMGMAMSFTTFFGTVFHLVAAALLLWLVSWFHKRHAPRPQLAN